MRTTLALPSLPVNTDTDLDAHGEDRRQDAAAEGERLLAEPGNCADRSGGHKGRNAAASSKARRRLSPEEIAARDSHHAEGYGGRPVAENGGPAAIEGPNSRVQSTADPTAEPVADKPAPSVPAPGRDAAGESDSTGPAEADVDGEPVSVNAARQRRRAAKPSSRQAVSAANTGARGKRPALALDESSSDEVVVRRGRLEAIRPTGPRGDVAAVKGTVVDLVMAIPYRGYESDRSLMTAGVAFGRWCLSASRDGCFVPSRDLNQDAIEAYLRMEKGEVTAATRRTYVSQLRRLARGGSPRHKAVVATQAAAPYSDKVRGQLWAAACNNLPDWMSVEMRTLLALTFGAGCSSKEVVKLRAEDVTRVAQRTMVTVVNRDTGEVREVPVYNQYGAWLNERFRALDPQDLLFYGSLKSRRNTVNSLVQRSTRHANVFEGFRVSSARNTWLRNILQAGVPFHAACQVAGIGPDSTLPTNMLPYMAAVTGTDVRRIFDHAYAVDGFTAAEQPCDAGWSMNGHPRDGVRAMDRGVGDAAAGGGLL